ncbi:MAG: DNA polymerase III subunit beta [Anaerovoracaceae bacterium]
MKFTCNQYILSKALNIVSKAVTSRTTIPLLKGILLEATADGFLKLTATDLDLSIEKKIPISLLKEGSIVVSAKLFNDIIRKLPNEEIEIEVDDNNSIIIRCLASKFSIVGQPTDEFPDIGAITKGEKIRIEKEVLREMIKKTSFSASIEESKGTLVGVLIEMKENSLTMVALDGFRMAIARELMNNKENDDIIISAKNLDEINKIFTEIEGTTELDIILDEKKAVFFIDDVCIVSRLLEGEFIKYQEILPKEFQCKVKVNRAELLESIERASLFAKEGKNNLIKISVTDDKFIITSKSEEGNVKEEVFVQNEGTNLEIGFNAKYLLDVLKAISDEEIYMNFNTSVTPCIINPIEGNSFEYLVLPVRISIY